MSRKRTKRAKVDVNKSKSDAFVLMSDILDKLYIIGYDKEFLSNNNFIPLTNGYFSYSTNIAEQFSYFQSLSLWLLKYIGHSFMEWDDYQDPNSISNNILQECKKLNFTKEFASTKLRQGSGQEICEILNFLTDIAIKKQNYQIKQPIFHKPKYSEMTHEQSPQFKNDNNDNNEMSDESLVEDIMDSDSDIEQSDNENNINNNMNNRNKYFSNSSSSSIMNNNINNNNQNNDFDEHKTTMSVIETNINSAEWKLELEKVSSLLEDRYITGISEWVIHLKKSKFHGKLLGEIWPDSKLKLQKYNNKLSKYLERINVKENNLNREFKDLSLEYKTKYNNLDNLKKEYNESISKISTLTNDLQEINEKINDIKIEMENRNNSMTDMAPIRRLRDTHSKLKKELIDLDLRIGVTRQQLLHSKLKHENMTH